MKSYLRGDKKCIWLIFLLGAFAACKKNESSPDYPTGSRESINSWILDSMKVYYYWNNSLPQKPDFSQEPMNFFSGLKNSADRFSLLVNKNSPISYNPSLVSAFGVDLLSFERGGDLTTCILLVVPGSAASRAGIKRGDVVTAIDGLSLSAANAVSLVKGAIVKGSMSLKLTGMPSPVLLTSTYPVENPIYTSRIITAGQAKIAYLFLNAFRTNAVSNLKQVFNDFLAASPNELIIDMRYNSGGEVSVAALLVAMIGTVRGSDTFLEYRGNAKAGIKRNNFDKELSYIAQTTAQLTTYRLSLNRVYILTGKHTASSAELLANCLSPYIDVIRIGEQTLGKDMASFEIKDSRIPIQVSDWVIHPLVYKLYNANGQGDYSAGLKPSIEINELLYLPLLPLGDENDPLIAAAIQQISGKQSPASAGSLKSGAGLKVIMDSRDKVDEQTRVIQLKD